MVNKDRNTEKNKGLIYRKMREDYYRGREKVENKGINPPNCGIMDKPDGHAKVTGESGETIEIFLRMKDKIVEEARFTADRCLFTKAVCSAATQLVTGKTISDGLKIDADAVTGHLGGIPEDHEHCVNLAVTVMREAIRNGVAKETGNQT